MPVTAALSTLPAVARAFVRATLSGWHLESLTEGAELMASELTSNAVAASTDGSGCPVYINGRMSVVRVRLVSDGTARVVLEVWDQAPGIPAVRDVAEYEENGRGLVLVDAIADRWGWCPATGPGKVVWAEMSP
ncbi:MAG: ATP-binding protein [Streptosporangiaceae bacterium]